MKYTVLRHHIGDKEYKKGDTREAMPADVAHLIGTVLAETKSAPSLDNKQDAAFNNKARKG